MTTRKDRRDRLDHAWAEADHHAGRAHSLSWIVVAEMIVILIQQVVIHVI